ncbi:segregation/condensation protein A [Ferroglobus sp.]|uniref:segregation/condensation protein A n=1 Tax=Ferroglobus sp. TaxID=2614230 RepID=UPI0025C35764|nr:segregation/condensation protein A [Ferroglobus sp.]
MAKKGEIDPWNVDVVEVADKFLEELERAKKLDLRVSGRVLLYAAILVRMKSEILTNELLKVEEEESFEEYFQPEFQDFEFEEYVVEDIEDEVIKSLIATGSRKKKLRRYTTLKDLIEELKKAEERRRKKKRKVRREKDVREDPLETPHEENVEEWIREAEKIIFDFAKRMEIIPFSKVCGEDIVRSYVSILHLAFRKKIEIWQEKIFESEVLLRWIDERGN